MARKKHYSEEKSHKSQMIYEDHSAPCLLPMGVISKDWPQKPSSNIGMIGGDLFDGVQKQMHKDQSDFGKIRNPKKY